MVSGSKSPLKIGWFSTGRGEGSYGLLSSALEAIDSGDLPAELAFVFVNRAKGQTKRTDRFIELVESRGIPLITLSSRDFRRANDNKPWAKLREAFDEAAIELLRPHKADIAVHAGYMLIAPLLCSEYLTLNLHPALPGGTIGMWQQAVWDVITEGLDETGAMIHVSTEDVDEGPVLSTATFSVRGSEFVPGFRELQELDALGMDYEAVKLHKGEGLLLFKAIREAGLLRERPLLIETLKAVGEGRIDPTGAGDVADLSVEVERAVGNAR